MTLNLDKIPRCAICRLPMKRIGDFQDWIYWGCQDARCDRAEMRLTKPIPDHGPRLPAKAEEPKNAQTPDSGDSDAFAW